MQLGQGESTSTKTTNLYLSKPTDLSLSDKRIKTIHYFPNIAPMPTVKMEKADIRWKIIVEATTTFGWKVDYEQTFN